MGGNNETKISGLRLHENSGQVHIHDDKSGSKFILNASLFKKEITDSFKQLQKKEGIIRIAGNTSNCLYLLKDGNSYEMFIGGPSIKSDLQKFIRGI